MGGNRSVIRDMVKDNDMIVNDDGSINVNLADAETGDTVKVHPDGSTDINVQDQTTDPIDEFLSEDLGDFTLSADAIVDTNVISITPGHGLIAGDEILLLDTATENVYSAVIISFAGDDATLDNLLDCSCSAATIRGKHVNTNMAVDGSVTRRIFAIRAGTTPNDVVRLNWNILDSTSMDDAKFGGIAGGLLYGCQLRITNNGTRQNIFNFKTNADFGIFAYDRRYDDKAPAGQEGMTVRSTFGGQSKHGVVLRIDQIRQVQVIIQDDLTDLDEFRVVAQGHLTSGE